VTAPRSEPSLIQAWDRPATDPARRTVFMFSGQGSQYFQMGRELFDKNDTFRQWMTHLDAVAGRSSGKSVVETLYGTGRKSDVFDRTLLTHPAIFMVEYSLAQSLMHTGITPDIVLGASLGSFAAAAVAGFIGVEDALNAVIQQAAFLESCCEPGGMLAVLADPVLLTEKFLSENSELAGINFSSHFVISARQPGLAGIEAELRKRAITHQRLPVSFAFHSRWIDQAQAPFAPFMPPTRSAQGRLPLVCCEQAAVLTDLSNDYFWRVVRHPIRFRETMAQLERYGVHRYVDVGPAGTLATFLKYGLPTTSKSTVHAILTPYGQDQKNLAALVASTRH